MESSKRAEFRLREFKTYFKRHFPSINASSDVEIVFEVNSTKREPYPSLVVRRHDPDEEISQIIFRFHAKKVIFEPRRGSNTKPEVLDLRQGFRKICEIEEQIHDTPFDQGLDEAKSIVGDKKGEIDDG